MQCWEHFHKENCEELLQHYLWAPKLFYFLSYVGSILYQTVFILHKELFTLHAHQVGIVNLLGLRRRLEMQGFHYCYKCKTQTNAAHRCQDKKRVAKNTSCQIWFLLYTHSTWNCLQAPRMSKVCRTTSSLPFCSHADATCYQQKAYVAY